MKSSRELRLLVAVGSRHDQVCSVGAFARAEAAALRECFRSVDLLEPTADAVYPDCKSVSTPDVILFNAPALHDRKHPWNAIVAAAKLRRAFPNAKFVCEVHEYSEAPTHWKLRQISIAKLSDAVVVNSAADWDGLRHWHKNMLRAALGPTLFLDGLPESKAEVSSRFVERAVQESKNAIAASLKLSSEMLVVHPGLVTPGKGVNSLEKLIGIFEGATQGNYRLVIAGGKGPKERDRAFADQTIRRLQEATRGKFMFLEGATDETFKKLLTAADLIVLPYDEGVSERRSSFLSAMWCAGNVWITSGRYSAPLELGGSGAHSVSAEKFFQGHGLVRSTIEAAFAESAQHKMERRMANLKWAYGRSWKVRSAKLAEFFQQAAKPKDL